FLMPDQPPRATLFPYTTLFRSADDLIQVDAEVTELAYNATNFLRESPTWYTHHVVRDGYTHQGQVLGAGIGPGSNVQSIDVSWVDRKSTRLNSSHVKTSYAVFC